MPFSGSTFTGVSGSTNAAPGQIVQSAVWNNINTDYATALTMLMSQLVSEISNRNALWMNGGLEVWQRGAGSSSAIAIAASTTAYTADRWYLTTGTGQASVVSAQTGLTTPSQLCARVLRNAAQTGTGVMYFAYPLDTDEILRLRGSKVSFTAAVRAGANWSPASGTLTVNLYVGTGSVGKRGGTPYTTETTVLTIATNLTAGGAVTTITGSSASALPATATQAELQFTWTPVGTAGAADYFEVDDVQLESQLSASTWTPTKYDRISFPEMLAGCKRHFQKTFPYGTAPAQAVNAGTNTLMGVGIDNFLMYVNWELPVETRVTGTLTTYSPYTGATANWYNFTSSASIAVQVNASFQGTKNIFIYSAASALVNNALCMIHATTDAGI